MSQNIDNIHLPEAPSDQEKYLYTKDSELKIHGLYLIGMITWIISLIGYVLFFNQNIWYWFTLAPIILIISIYHLGNYGINLFYKKFDVEKHLLFTQNYWLKNQTTPPISIDVYLPVCGEEGQILENTWKGVESVAQYGKIKNLYDAKVYVLDDKGEQNVVNLAHKFGFNYISRENKGYLKKAGNLLNAFHITKGEFYTVFDADFVPREDFLHDLLPYFEDKKVGIIQSPQFFRLSKDLAQNSPIEYGAGSMQEDFYKVIQNARNSFGASICVGSNAIYRRSALMPNNGPARVDHGEDVHTGLEMIASGSKIKYIPLNLAGGLSPDTSLALFKQHNRWCSSSTGMFLSGKVLKLKTTLMQKFCYHLGFLFYIQQIFYFFLPIQLFVILYFHFDNVSLQNAAFFYPYILWAMFVLPASRRAKSTIGSKIASINNVYTHSLTVILRFFGRSAVWVPTGTVKKDALFTTVRIGSFAYIFVFLNLVLYLISVGKAPLLNVQYYSVLFWVFYNLFTHVLFLSATFDTQKTTATSALNTIKSNNAYKLRFAPVYASVLIIIFGSYFLSVSTSLAGQGSREVAGTNETVEQMTSTKDKAENTAPVEQKFEVISIESKLQIENPQPQFKTYSYTANAGDSNTLLIRKMIKQYHQEKSKTLDKSQATFTETILAQKQDPNLEIGERVSLNESDIEEVLGKYKDLNDSQKDAWGKYSLLTGY